MAELGFFLLGAAVSAGYTLYMAERTRRMLEAERRRSETRMTRERRRGDDAIERERALTEGVGKALISAREIGWHDGYRYGRER